MDTEEEIKFALLEDRFKTFVTKMESIEASIEKLKESQQKQTSFIAGVSATISLVWIGLATLGEKFLHLFK